MDAITPALSRAQAARALNISLRKLDYLVGTRRIGSVVIDGRRVFTPQHITDFLAANESRAADTTQVPGQLPLFDLADPTPPPPAEARLAA